MIRAVLYSPDRQQIVQKGGREVLDSWDRKGTDWLWLDLQRDPDQEAKDLLSGQFGIHELAISDAFRVRHPPKIENFDGYTFLLARGLDAKTTDIYYKTIQLSFFFGSNFLLTYHSKESLSVNRVWNDVESGEVRLDSGPVFITCKILRALVDRYTPILLNLEKRLEEMEDELFTTQGDALLEELVEYNSNLKKMRRTLTYHSNVLGEFYEQYSESYGDRLRHRVQDVYEHFERLRSLSDLYQELIVDLMNGYLSLSSHRLNQIMKVLTIFTVVFLPLTLMVGIYGMNFDYMPELRWRYGYFALLSAMGSVVLVAIGFFRWKKWL